MRRCRAATPAKGLPDSLSISGIRSVEGTVGDVDELGDGAGRTRAAIVHTKSHLTARGQPGPVSGAVRSTFPTRLSYRS